ncbi:MULTISPECIES: choice-of-anchor I family protein [unclassified Thalassolituus]|mgnify:CR=1 FL=1|uniref:choice-of-anchor I family protein n=1 Tax=unclassified Thalassolituus TaxID=2624967 RepID=UPI0025DBA072|nr:MULTISPECIES: choice-of-anchor I family protein [unclassified Thalassolituus]|tara:strand:+ start:3750 stop:5570 length:1821 start_codon:yes stop_codon:yes gene_type:complete
MKRKLLALAIGCSLLAACGGSSNNADNTPDNNQDNAPENPQPETPDNTPVGTLNLALLATHTADEDFATSAAEIVSYDTCSNRLYVVNAEAETVDVLEYDATAGTLTKDSSIDLSGAAADAGIDIGAANSVSAKDCKVAVAIEADEKQDDGIIALYDSADLSLLATYSAGALPDMVTLSADGNYILTANEGEPSADYQNDPEGSVTIVDISAGYDSAVVHQVHFRDFNVGGSRAAELPAGVRISGPAGTTVAQDLEPEYMTLSADGSTAWVALQENNAMAIIDVANASVSSIVALGGKMWDSASANQLDASNKDDGTGQFASYEQLAGLYMPDTLASVEIGGATYVLSANEGDGREYVYETSQQTCEAAGQIWDGDDFSGTPGYSLNTDDCISHIDEMRGGDLYDLVDEAHPLYDALDDNDQLKRLKFVVDSDSYGAADTLYAFGARSFSIWNAAGELVFDSGDDIAKRVFAADGDNFNSDNESNDSADSRSDDKGVEPEAIEVATIGSRVFAFIGLERQGGIMVYEITDPTAPVFQSYLNNRDFSEPVCTEVDEDAECDNDTYNTAAGDLGPESIEYFSRDDKHYIAVGNEVSGTTSVYELTFTE